MSKHTIHVTINGTAYEDHVTIGSAVVDNQIIGSAGYLDGFTDIWPIDGIRERHFLFIAIAMFG